ncbi:MAG: response regulator transcription factor, partial [Brasilonema sp.]
IQVAVAASAPYKVLQSIEQIVNEVIFESDVDGVLYYVVRSTPKYQEKISLSPREKAIANLVAQGLPNKLIGIRLDISPWTVATHLRRIFVKLGVTSRTAMIARVFKENLLKD